MFKHTSRRWFAIVILVAALLSLTAAASAQSAPPFRVYMAFEDGPTDSYTPGILDILAQYNAKATFLIAGAQIAGNEDLLQREVREGHTIVNHLWEEVGVYAGAPDEPVIASYLKTEEAIRAALGPELPHYDAQIKMYWQPGGGAQPLPEIPGVQVITYNWNVNSDDCGWGLTGIDLDTLDFDAAVIDNVLNEPRSTGQLFNVYDYGDGVVIAFHDLNRVTGRVLPTILEELRSAGATFEALPRPWDSVGSMPIKLGEPPAETGGILGVTLSASVLDVARVRSGPGLEHETIDNLPLGAVVTATGRTNGWIAIQYDGKNGWIYSELLKIRGPIPSLPLIS